MCLASQYVMKERIVHKEVIQWVSLLLFLYNNVMCGSALLTGPVNTDIQAYLLSNALEHDRLIAVRSPWKISLLISTAQSHFSF